jgi:hypothetical protein
VKAGKRSLQHINGYAPGRAAGAAAASVYIGFFNHTPCRQGLDSIVQPLFAWGECLRPGDFAGKKQQETEFDKMEKNLAKKLGNHPKKEKSLQVLLTFLYERCKTITNKRN